MTNDATAAMAKPPRGRRAVIAAAPLPVVASADPHPAADLRAAASPATAPSPAAPGPSKSATVIKLLLRARGATPMELIAATDWQPHSVRAFLSGLRKKGRVIVRTPRKTGEAAYHIDVTAVAAGMAAEPPADAAKLGDATQTGAAAWRPAS